MNLVHLLASPFVGGPEKQVLGLANHLPGDFRQTFLSFPEQGKAEPFLRAARSLGFPAEPLHHNTPQFRQAVAEVAHHLREVRADLLTCHGYKPDIVGWLAARQARVPVLSVSHGWTGATWKVKAYENLDRLVLRWMDRVVCVSQAQADRVRRAFVPDPKVVVIRNAISGEAFAEPREEYRRRLLELFPTPPEYIVGAAGRLSPEKGFDQLVLAVSQVLKKFPAIGCVHFGDGPTRPEVVRLIRDHGLERRFILAGFHADVARYLPFLDLCVLPSFTEGLPVVVLEAFAAGVPVVATAVGGTPEVVQDGINGFLVPPRDPAALAHRIDELLPDAPRRREMGRLGKRRVLEEFTFDAQARRYLHLFREVLGIRSANGQTGGRNSANVRNR